MWTPPRTGGATQVHGTDTTVFQAIVPRKVALDTCKFHMMKGIYSQGMLCVGRSVVRGRDERRASSGRAEQGTGRWELAFARAATSARLH